jgi:hypothetical protein
MMCVHLSTSSAYSNSDKNLWRNNSIHIKHLCIYKPINHHLNTQQPIYIHRPVNATCFGHCWPLSGRLTITMEVTIHFTTVCIQISLVSSDDTCKISWFCYSVSLSQHVS